MKLHILQQTVAVYHLHSSGGELNSLRWTFTITEQKPSEYSLALCTLHIVIYNLQIKSLIYLQACVHIHSGPDVHLPSGHSKLAVIKM
jgi:hypothetical protein